MVYCVGIVRSCTLCCSADGDGEIPTAKEILQEKMEDFIREPSDPEVRRLLRALSREGLKPELRQPFETALDTKGPICAMDKLLTHLCDYGTDEQRQCALDILRSKEEQLPSPTGILQQQQPVKEVNTTGNTAGE